jgi:ubiquinone/menaquinone biosynthesis C-methylase UbiE
MPKTTVRAKIPKALPPPPRKPSRSKPKRKADYYDDSEHNYLRFWQGRDYEHRAEELAIRRLLRGKHFKTAVDIGGGYGRLSLVLENYADKVILAEPSRQQLDLADVFLKGHPEIARMQVQADDLKLKTGSVDLVTMVRVMHQFPDPSYEFNEIARVLHDDGYAIIEVANYLHIRNRLKHLVRFQHMPVKPVDISSGSNPKDKTPFVNHNPHTVIRQLTHAGLRVEASLSVSNLRSVRLKRIMPREVMLGAERMLQRPMAMLYFGPSIFFLVHKIKPTEQS